MYQDNTSTMLLENNRKNSSKKKTKHLRVNYFILNYRIEMNDLSVKFCRTVKMISDHLTNLLHGALFRKFGAELMNISEDADTSEMEMNGTGLTEGVTWKLHNKTNPSCPQECIGDYDMDINPAEGMWDRKGQHNGIEINKKLSSTIMSKRERLRKDKYVHIYIDALRGKKKEILWQ